MLPDKNVYVDVHLVLTMHDRYPISQLILIPEVANEYTRTELELCKLRLHNIIDNVYMYGFTISQKKILLPSKQKKFLPLESRVLQTLATLY